MYRHFIYCILLLAIAVSCKSRCATDVVIGAEQTDWYLSKLAGKRVAVLSNHSGMVGDKHVVDLLLEKGVDIEVIFSPEHGFRGTAGAGDHVADGIDEQTGIPIISLYNGSRSRPTDSIMNCFDVLVFDIQDVGLRFYTYYITMVRMMQSCAEQSKQMIVLDRPNPNGFIVDGPILDMRYKSGVGYLPIPVLHGMTLGELALMVNGEHWLDEGKVCDLEVIPCKNYTHSTRYRLPVAPSPNLRDMLAIYLYPSICLFEGTQMSLGRGTDKPFLCYGHPDMQDYSYSFIPHSMPSAPHPPHQDRVCYGVDLSTISEEEAQTKGVDLSYLIEAYRAMNIGDAFFTPFFEKLIGVSYVRQMIEQGKSAEQIRACWQDDVDTFRVQRRPYLLYEE